MDFKSRFQSISDNDRRAELLYEWIRVKSASVSQPTAQLGNKKKQIIVNHEKHL